MFKVKNDAIAGVFLSIPIALLCMTIFGCTTAPRNKLPPNQAAPMPGYKQGTKFIYSDGTWETVISVNNGLVTWQDYREKVYTSSPDFTYRPISWQSKAAGEPGDLCRVKIC